MLLFFSEVTDAFLMSSHILKQLDHMMIYYFYLVCFTFSISYSIFSFHLVYAFQFFRLFFLMFSLKLSSVVESFCIHIYIYIYFRKLINFCLAKNFMTFWFHLFDNMNRMHFIFTQNFNVVPCILLSSIIAETLDNLLS